MRRVLAVILMAGLAACGKDSTAPSPFLGRFTLVSVNGKALPYSVTYGTDSRIDLLADAFTLGSDGKFKEDTQTRFTTSGQSSLASLTILGTFKRAGTLVTFTQSDSNTYSGVFSSNGDTLTVILAYSSMRYVR